MMMMMMMILFVSKIDCSTNSIWSSKEETLGSIGRYYRSNSSKVGRITIFIEI
jgi:hypothetical protein